MRTSRLVPVVAAGALVAATVTPASAAEPGVGTTTATLEVLGVDVGEVLQLGLLGDGGAANTDPDVGARSAVAELTALSLVSEALDLDHSVDLVRVSAAEGEEDTASQPASGVPANPLVDGTVLPVDLSALVGTDGAVSSIGAGVADLSVLGGILGLTSTDLDLGSNALTEQADGARSLRVDGLSVLDLEDLLAGLGIPLAGLPLESVLGLIDGLGLTGQLADALETLGLADVLADLGLDPVDLEDLDGEGLLALAGDLSDARITLSEGISALDGACDVLDPAIIAAAALLGITPEVLCADTVAQLAELTDDLALLDALLAGALETVVDLLGGVALLSLDGLDVGVVTKATDSLDTSVADVTASLGQLQVGSLPPIDLDVLGATQDVVDEVDAHLNGILAIAGLSGAGLEDLLSVTLLEEVTSVTEQDGGIVSTAEFTGLGVDLAPPDLEALSGLIGTLGGDDSLGVLADTLGVEVPVSPLTGLNADLTEAAGGQADVLALASGLSMDVASLGQQSSFEVLSATATPTPAAPTAPQLPRTGSSDTAWLLLAGIAAAGALGIRRWMTVKE